MNKLKRTLTLVIVLGIVTGAVCFGADGSGAGGEAAGTEKSDLLLGLIAFAAAVAVGMCGIATGIAQSRIGAAGCGAIAEKPETMGTVIILLAIPETVVILGFVVAITIVFAL